VTKVIDRDQRIDVGGARGNSLSIALVQKIRQVKTS
jgi:hypothetical protein